MRVPKRCGHVISFSIFSALRKYFSGEELIEQSKAHLSLQR
ncbi:MAG: hypothetical protein ACTSR0_01560 [Candidatus Asgardarchaeia archaeon]